jgi:hypothetical protein
MLFPHPRQTFSLRGVGIGDGSGDPPLASRLCSRGLRSSSSAGPECPPRLPARACALRPFAQHAASTPNKSVVAGDTLRNYGEMGTRTAINSQSSVYRFFAMIGSATGHQASKRACCTISTRTFLVSAGLLTSRKNAMRAPRTPSCVFTRI